MKNHDAYAAAEARDGMIPWNGDTENMIDRFDGRALLDFYRDPDGHSKPQKSDAEEELDEVGHLFTSKMHLNMMCWGHAAFWTTEMSSLNPNERHARQPLMPTPPEWCMYQ